MADQIEIPADSEISLRVRLYALQEVITDVNKTGTPEERALLKQNVIPQQRALNAKLIALLQAKRTALGEPDPPAQTTSMQPLYLYGEALDAKTGPLLSALTTLLDTTGLDPEAILSAMKTALQEMNNGER